METRVVFQSENHIDANVIKEAGELIREGELVAFPTETVYGLGGDALNVLSSAKIYAAKGRPSDNPLIVHICRFEDLYRICSRVPEAAVRLAKAYWPGPLTMILPKADCVPKETTGGLDTVAVRFPSHPVAQAFIEAAGGFVAAPSANASGRPSPTLAKYVLEDMDGEIPLIIDGGPVGIGVESTIIDLTEEEPTLLRPGYITKEMLEQTLGEIDQDRTMMESNPTGRPKAPGMRYRHYAPKGQLTLVSGKSDKVAEYINEHCRLAREDHLKTGVLCTRESLSLYRADEIDSIKCIGSRASQESVARELYRALRECDDEGLEVIYAESFSEEGLGQAVMNRLLKAAGHQMVELP
ncbi:MAG: threonylcarbamoyl-AMP synthase [Lachnospiraceae bacterium]|nr:threonylcarbamoyl-AMP synthase [Lachnospiraceae bacterium]